MPMGAINLSKVSGTDLAGVIALSGVLGMESMMIRTLMIAAALKRRSLRKLSSADSEWV